MTTAETSSVPFVVRTGVQVMTNSRLAAALEVAAQAYIQCAGADRQVALECEAFHSAQSCNVS